MIFWTFLLGEKMEEKNIKQVDQIMTKYKSNYGVTNKKDGVEFYFEIPEAK